MKKRIKKKLSLSKVKVSQLGDLRKIKGGTNGITCNSDLVQCSDFCGTNDC